VGWFSSQDGGEKTSYKILVEKPLEGWNGMENLM
jgi:hypothetical protein